MATLGGRGRGKLVAGLLTLLSAGVWLLSSHDPVRESIMGFVLREKTEYASGFSEGALGTVTRGQSENDVRQALGAPLREMWYYEFDETQSCMTLDFAQDEVVWAREPDACLELGIDAGTPRSAVQGTLGSPTDACWMYTRSPADAYFRERTVCFRNGKVINVFRQWSSRAF